MMFFIFIILCSKLRLLLSFVVVKFISLSVYIFSLSQFVYSPIMFMVGGNEEQSMLFLVGGMFNV